MYINVSSLSNVSMAWTGLPDHLGGGAVVVVFDMSLSLISVVANLIVITAIKENESLLGNTFNVLLANLCFSNLVAAVFVKAFAIVYNGYAVAAGTTIHGIAFCTMYTASYRMTWAVLPWSIVMLTWLTIIPRLKKLKDFIRTRREPSLAPCSSLEMPTSTDVSSLTMTRVTTGLSIAQSSVSRNSTTASNTAESTAESKISKQYSDDDDDDEKVKLTQRQKGVLGFVWVVGLVYCLMSKQILSKGVPPPCSVEEQLSNSFSIASIVIALIIPTIVGPILVTVLHIILSIVFLILGCNNAGESTKNDDVPSASFLIFITIIFIMTYSLNMILCEVYLPLPDTILVFIILKYSIGNLHLLLTPLLIIFCRRDIWRLAKKVYARKGATQTDGAELTFEQIQRELGMGVDIS